MNSQTMPTYPDLAGKVVLVTGGSRGIGATTCEAFAANGARVAVSGRDTAAIDSVVERIRAHGGTAIGAPADCTDGAAIEYLSQKVEADLGPVDVLAAFAGGNGEPVPLQSVVDDDWRAVVDANLNSTFITVRPFLPTMVERRSGVIITMSSAAGRQPGYAHPAYTAAKAGIVMLTRHLARDLGQHNIRVNCIAPSAILTDRLRQRLPDDVRERVPQQFPLARWGTPADCAYAALFLASDSSSWITGQTLDVAGGKIMM
jgi:3-oxoacyl-[acyl-carrier protein] reductase